MGAIEAKSLDKTEAEYSADRENTNAELSAVLEYYSKIKDRCIARPEAYANVRIVVLPRSKVSRERCPSWRMRQLSCSASATAVSVVHWQSCELGRQVFSRSQCPGGRGL